MTFEVLGNFIASNGFPIAACIALAWYVYVSNEKSNKRIDDLTERVLTALNSNTEALTRLTDQLQRGQKNGDT